MHQLAPTRISAARLKGALANGLDLVHRRAAPVLGVGACGFVLALLFSFLGRDFPDSGIWYIASFVTTLVWLAINFSFVIRLGLEDDGFSAPLSEVLRAAFRSALVFLVNFLAFFLVIQTLTALLQAALPPTPPAAPATIAATQPSFWGGAVGADIARRSYDCVLVVFLMVSSYAWTIGGAVSGYAFSMQALHRNVRLYVAGLVVYIPVSGVVLPRIADGLGGGASILSLSVVFLSPTLMLLLYPLVREMCGGSRANGRFSEVAETHTTAVPATG